VKGQERKPFVDSNIFFLGSSDIRVDKIEGKILKKGLFKLGENTGK